ncbi:signal peptidase I [Candidatus Saccharibacteria bacterium]|nr:signal peptidase I [Candidatus Saccharibacteria bacterium]
MLRRLRSINAPTWGLLCAMLVMAAVSVVARSTDVIPSKLFLYGLQPGMSLAIAGLSVALVRGKQDRVRHRAEKAYLVGSVMAVWFVLYFLSGLITTYVENSLVAGLSSMLINIWTFGVVAAAIEYSRHGIMQLVNRRDVVWFGIAVATVLAIQQMSFGQLSQADGLDGFIKLAVSDFIPVIMSSLLLTYLAIAGGLPAMLVYRLGLVATVIFPPIIPKYDWYLQGISLILLTVSAYIAIDRTRQDRQVASHRYRHHPKMAYDLMWLAVMLGLVLFVTGFLSYKPSAIVSNSMKPVYSRGAIVVVQKIGNPMDVQVGDIVQYQRKDKLITHRVVVIDNAADGSGKRVFITKGDNSPSQDPIVTETQLVGIVRAAIPFAGYPSVWLQETVQGKQQADVGQ